MTLECVRKCWKNHTTTPCRFSCRPLVEALTMWLDFRNLHIRSVFPSFLQNRPQQSKDTVGPPDPLHSQRNLDRPSQQWQSTLGMQAFAVSHQTPPLMDSLSSFNRFELRIFANQPCKTQSTQSVSFVALPEATMIPGQ